MIGQRATALSARAPIASDGCYFLCIAALAWETGDPTRQLGAAELIAAYDDLNRAGAMRRSASDSRDGCYITNPQAVLDRLGGRAQFLGIRSPYQLAFDERAIELWQLAREPRGLWTHFTLGSYDPWPRSVTRRDGELASLRVWRL